MSAGELPDDKRPAFVREVGAQIGLQPREIKLFAGADFVGMILKVAVAVHRYVVTKNCHQKIVTNLTPA
jgi:hypothetical protein